MAWIDSHHYYLRPMSLILDYRSIGIELYRFGFERFEVKLRIEIRYFILAYKLIAHQLDQNKKTLM